jgi:hypothetical protein
MHYIFYFNIQAPVLYIYIGIYIFWLFVNINIHCEFFFNI